MAPASEERTAASVDYPKRHIAERSPDRVSMGRTPRYSSRSNTICPANWARSAAPGSPYETWASPKQPTHRIESLVCAPTAGPSVSADGVTAFPSLPADSIIERLAEHPSSDAVP